MERKTWYLLAFSAIVFLLAALIGFYGKDKQENITTDLVAIGAAILAVTVARELLYKGKAPVVDERTKKIVRFASSYSWWLSYVLIAILILVDQFNLATLSAQSVLGLVFFFMVFSQFALRFYFERKGDVE
ncbi:Uncharacterised protein [uncultured archaeon]|nr:Uncharacterised protein [uncultured archaeon]